MRPVAPLALVPLLLLLSCGSAGEVSDGWAEIGQVGAEQIGACAPATTLEQPRERYEPESCWRVVVPAGFGLTEADGPGDCVAAPSCLVTRLPVVRRELLDWTAEGEDSPETWQEVPCSARCP